MRTIRAVAFKEIQIYFSSPVAYIVALIFMALSGFFFVRDLGNPFPEASLSNFFQGATFLLIPLAPALTMRLLAEEQKLGTIELLLTSPVRDWEVILGKYLASFVFLLFLLSLTSYYVILLLLFATPDPGPIYSGYLGLILYGAAALAVGILTSTLTSNQIVAAVVGTGILVVLYATSFIGDVVTGVWATIFNQLGFTSHFNDFDRGIIDSTHIVYFVTVTALFLFLSIRALESRRWR
ncbi:MAG: ABC transporter permease subunit [Chloroflexota bacterium]|nr:ABC transporter permease subunit [Chloroflexota bacterium]MDE2960548.1 ABC transporter permease subunit [Chloroflexota bacterium]